MRITLVALMALTLGTQVIGQQREPNSPGGSATLNGSGPSGVGTPLNIGINQSLDLRIAGTPGAPYTLLYGSLAAASIPQGNQYVDIDISSFGVLVDGLNLNLARGAFPSVLGILNATGNSTWSFPLSSAALGTRMCFQGVVLDSASSIGLNITGAPEFHAIGPITTFNGDDALFHYSASAAVSLYGHSTTSVSVSTNGWLSLTSLAAFSDLGESTTKFLNGNVGGAPMGSAPVVACLWEDLDMANGVPGQEVIISEPGPSLLQVTWANGDYFPLLPFGSVSCLIDSANHTVTLDYSGYATALPPMEGIIGVSDGGSTGVATPAEIDLAGGGLVLGYGGAPTEDVFQNFSPGSLFAEPVDLAGLVLHFQDTGAGTGSWVVF